MCVKAGGRDSLCPSALTPAIPPRKNMTRRGRKNMTRRGRERLVAKRIQNWVATGNAWVVQDWNCLGLREIPCALPANLQRLTCHSNKLTALPSPLPPGLTMLNCRDNRLLTKLLPLPPGLVVLDIRRAGITRLPPLPATLLSLFSSGIQHWSPLPPNLMFLDYSDSAAVPPLPLALRSLVCEGVARLPPLPPGLRHLKSFTLTDRASTAAATCVAGAGCIKLRPSWRAGAIGVLVDWGLLGTRHVDGARRAAA
jgi:hypothetical protein